MKRIVTLLSISTLSCITQAFSAQAQIAVTEEKFSESLKVEVISLEDNFSSEPIPGTVATSSKILWNRPQTRPQAENQVNHSSDPDDLVAQRDIYLGRLNRHDYGYIGAGVNLGFNNKERSPLNDIAFTLNAKIAFNNNVSLRPLIIFSRQTAFLIPVTYDFTVTGKDVFDPVPIVPFIGGGAIFTTQERNSAGFLLTGGLDYRFARDFVANATLNVGFLGEGTDAGIFLGIGYILSGKSPR